ncbi:hypothetical protein OCAR_7304 [Afipia carboxidovorans OM5]|nr:hypothetical protein OCAR_7304 [Afipia carboxidovorans OM5]
MKAHVSVRWRMVFNHALRHWKPSIMPSDSQRTLPTAARAV